MSTELTYRCEELQRGILSVSLAPELNEAPWADIDGIGADIVERARSRDRPGVIVDLSALNYMGSAMVALVVRIWKAVSERNGEMVVVNNSVFVGEVLEISGLATKWTIVPNRELAIQELGGESDESNRDGGSPRQALVWLAVAVAALVLGVLGTADAISGGVVRQAAGLVPLLGTAAGLAGLGVFCAAMAARSARNAVQLMAVVVATLAGVLLVASVLLIVNRNVWNAEGVQVNAVAD